MSDVAVSAQEPAGSLIDPAVLDDPYDFYARVRRSSPVWTVPGTSIVVVTSFAAVSEAIGRPDDFSSNITSLLYRADDGTPATTSFGGDGIQALATADPPGHAVHRRAVFPELVNRRMGELRPEVEALALEHIDSALERESIDFMPAIADAIPIRVVSRLIGWDGEDADALLAAAFDSTEILSANRTLEQIEAAIERTAAIGGWIAEQVVAALADPPDHGLLGAVATAIAAEEIDLTTGIVILHTLLSAGGESTTSLLGNAVDLLARDRELQQRLREEPELLTPFVEEVLRLESPFRYHLRTARREAELDGVTVPAGATVLLMWGAANRDPDEFEHPDAIDLGRPSPRHHVGFGRGIHLCVGAPLARLEADVVLGRFLARTRSFTLDPAAPAVREDSLMIRRFRSLPLVVEGVD